MSQPADADTTRRLGQRRLAQPRQSDLAEDRAAPDDVDCQHVWLPTHADEAMRRRTNRTAKHSPNAVAGLRVVFAACRADTSMPGFDTQTYVATK
jgi:hypothetical protein